MTGLIEDYVSYASRITDAPIEYHRALALNLESACIGRTPIAVTPNPMYPHVWTMPLGRAGKDRKTTSIAILNSVVPSPVARVSNEYSREGLLAELSQLSPKCEAIALFDECGGLLKQMRNPKHYLSGLDDTFCSLYSETGDFKRKIRSETFTIHEPYFNLVWATTLRKFKRCVSVDAYTSGFLARIQLVIAENSESRPRRNLDSEDTRLLAELKAKAQGIYDIFHKHQFSFKFEAGAFEMIGRWQMDKETVEYDNEDINDAYGTVATRMGDYVIKHSALFQADKLSALSTSQLSNLAVNPIVISTDSVQKSIDYNDNLLSVISDKLLNSLSETGLSRHLARLSKVVLRCADSEGWAERQRVLPRMHMKAHDFEEILQTAIQSGEIECKNQDRKQLLRVPSTPQSAQLQYSEAHQRRALMLNSMPNGEVN